MTEDTTDFNLTLSFFVDCFSRVAAFRQKAIG